MPLREIDSNPDSLLFEFVLDAPQDRVFHFLTDPALLTRWWPPVAEVDARPGGTYVMTWPDQDWNLRGEFTARRSG